jgi:hypothetical protein
MLISWWLACRQEPAPPTGRTPPFLDLSEQSTEGLGLMRVHGSSTTRGSFGVPVAGGGDVDGDTLQDVALSTMRAAPQGRDHAGIVSLIFGSGAVTGTLDTAGDPRILPIHGAGVRENAGSEIWMGDVTGDGLAELLVARQNAEVDGVVAAGALSIVLGSPALRELELLDLASPEAPVLTLGGSQELGRVGVWVRVGDATGDGVLDVLVGADQEEGHQGAAWLIEGGPHLQAGGAQRLAEPQGDLVGHVLRIVGPQVEEAHFGATVQLADLDGSGRAELLVAAALNRAGASLSPSDDISMHGKGGTLHGSVTVLWDAAVPLPPWAPGATVDTTDPALAGSVSTLTGSLLHNTFGEELVAGDWDADGQLDLFVGDLVSDLSSSASRPYAGVGVVLYGLGQHVGTDLSMDAPPADLAYSVLLGAHAGDLFGDTAVSGDFTGDGVDDLISTSPDADPADRDGAGLAALLVGGQRWPELVDLRHDALLPADELELIEIWGARGTTSSHDIGDMLAYSAATADLDGDGLLDLVSNEMLGNGLQPGTEDVGNLVVIAGASLRLVIEGALAEDP